MSKNDKRCGDDGDTELHFGVIGWISRIFLSELSCYGCPVCLEMLGMPVCLLHFIGIRIWIQISLFLVSILSGGEIKSDRNVAFGTIDVMLTKETLGAWK